MMKLTRAGIGMAIVGGIALAVHGMLLAKPARRRSDRALYGMLLAREAQLRSDCAAWGAAEETIEATTDGGFCQRTMWDWNDHEAYVRNALAEPEMRWLLLARSELVCRRESPSSVLPALRDPSFVGLVGAEDVTVEGRNMPLHEHGTIVREDLFTRAGRASWLLKEVTGHPAPIVGVQTDPRLLEDISKDWLFWLASMDGGNVCDRSDLVTAGARPHEPALRRALLDRLAEPFAPPCTELDLPRAYRSRKVDGAEKAHPVRWLGPSLPPGTVVYREVGLTEVAVYLSYKLDACSRGSRSPIPRHRDRPFQSIVIADSTAS
jgi:hypothetical protein